MEAISKPTMKIAELAKEEREVLLTLIRELIKPIKELTHTLGFEATEEVICKFIDEGIVKIVNDEETDGYYLTVYDFNIGRYRP
jgi:hypothetical protein